MGEPPEATEAPPPPEYGEGNTKDAVEVCVFDESADGFSRTVRAISELADLEPQPDFADAEVERLASSITFLREWRHFSYEPKYVSLNNGIESASSRDDMHRITLTQFSSASVPQIPQQEGWRDNTVSFDFILFAGGNIWALDWCPRLCDKPGSSINCEYLAVAAHPPGSSYHKIGMPLTGRGVIQVWCLLAPFEDAHSRHPLDGCNSISRRGRPRKIPDGTNCAGSSNPPKPRGRPRKRPHNDQLEPVPKRPRGRPRKHPPPVAKLEDSSQNSGNLDIVLFDPLATSTGIPDDLPLAYAMPTTESVKSTPKRGRGRPRKNPNDKPTGPSGAASKYVCTEPSPTTSICAKPKKPRGRPRKYPVTINDESVSGADVDLGQETTREPLKGSVVSKDVCTEPSTATAICAKPKKPLGRPRKHPVPTNDKSVSGADVDLVQETTCQPVSFSCSLDHTVCTEFSANLSIVAVDEPLPIINKMTISPCAVVKENACIEPSPTTATRKLPKRTRVRPRKYSDAEIELGKDTIGQPFSSECSLDHTAIAESTQFTSSSIAQNKKKTITDALCSPVVAGVESRSMCSRETIPDGSGVSVENALVSAQNMVSVTSDLCCASTLNSEDNVHKGTLGDSVQPVHISPKSRGSSGRRGRGRSKKNPLSVRTSCLAASGGSSPKTVSVPISSGNLTSLDKSYDEFVASNLGSSGCGIEKSSIHLGVVSSDAASAGHGIANCKDESSMKRGSKSRKKPVSTKHNHFTDFNGKEQKMLTTPKSSNPVILVENCMQGPCLGEGGGQPQRIPASHESSSTSVGGETRTVERLSTSMTAGSPRREDMTGEAGLIQASNGIAACEGMKVNESSTTNVISHCKNAQANQVAPSFKNSDRVIDELEATELIPLKEPREDDNMFSFVGNSNPSLIPKDIALPRVVLCLAHNGKVAWDIKWKPPLVSQFEQKSRLGFLAVLLGNGSLEVWEVPSPCMIQKIYFSSKVEGSDPRFLKLQPVFRCVKVECGNRQSIPLTVDWSPSPPHDMILAGCHDGTVALWNFSTNPSSLDSKPFMCVTAESVPIRALSWAPYVSEENINTFVTAGADGLKFWDLRDPYRPLWELTTAPRAVLSLQWLKDGRGIVISLEDGTLKFLSLARIANDVPATGRPFVGTKTQGVSTYQLSEYLIWSVHASDTTGRAAYCGADGTAVCFQLTPRFWEKEPGRNRVPYFQCGSLSEKGESIKISSGLQTSPLPNVPVVNKKGAKPCQNIVQALPANSVTGPLAYQTAGNSEIVDLVGDDQDDGHTEQGAGAVSPELGNDQDDEHSEEQGAGDVNPELGDDQDDGRSEEQGAGAVNPELGDDQDDGHCEEQGAGAIVLAGPTEQEDDSTLNSKGGQTPKDFEVFPPKSVALHRVRWNMNKGSERWLCYGGAAGIVRCQRI